MPVHAPTTLVKQYILAPKLPQIQFSTVMYIMKRSRSQFLHWTPVRRYSAPRNVLHVFSSYARISSKILTKSKASSFHKEHPKWKHLSPNFLVLEDDVVLYLSPSDTLPAARTSQMKAYFPNFVLKSATKWCRGGGGGREVKVCILGVFPWRMLRFPAPELTSTSPCCS